MSCAEVPEPTTTQCLPLHAAPPSCWLEWTSVPANDSAPGIFGMYGKPDMPVASTKCFGRSVCGRPSRMTRTSHSSACSS
jgi:hypothetical protein